MFRSQKLRKYVKGDSIEECTLPVREEKGQLLECSYTLAINYSQHFLIYSVRELFYGEINYKKFRIWNQCIPVE
jgi:hypothetical protein